jgi:hypothetical protein
MPAAPAAEAGDEGTPGDSPDGTATPANPSGLSLPAAGVVPRARPAGLAGTGGDPSTVRKEAASPAGQQALRPAWQPTPDRAGAPARGASWPTAVVVDPAAGPLTLQGNEAPASAGPDPAGSRVAAIMAPKPPVRPDRSERLGSPALQSASPVLPRVTAAVPGTVRATATEPGLPLNQTALVGIMHVDGASKALMRLPDGRYRSVVVGDVIEGWRISAIGTDAVRMSRSGEQRTLVLVNR